MLSTLVRHKRCPALAIFSLLLLSACGGGDSGPATAVRHSEPASPSAPQQPAQPVPPPAQSNPPPDVVLAETYTDIVAGTAGTRSGWPAWVAPPSRAAVGGVACTGTGTYHQHSLVSIYKDGVRMAPPANVGQGSCSYELHTHDMTGMVHIHTDVAKTYTLGQFFTLWGEPLATGGTAGLAGPVRFYVIENDKLAPYMGDPAQLELIPHREIVIISGASPGVLPKYRWPATL